MHIGSVHFYFSIKDTEAYVTAFTYMEHMNNIDGFVHSTLKWRPLRNPRKSSSTCRRARGDQVSFAIFTVQHFNIMRTCQRWHKKDRYGSRFMVGISSRRITHSQTLRTTIKCQSSKIERRRRWNKRRKRFKIPLKMSQFSTRRENIISNSIILW